MKNGKEDASTLSITEFKFRIGQTVHSPFGVVKIIDRWRNNSSTFYDVKFISYKDDVLVTKTWTSEEFELTPFTAGGVAKDSDDAAQLVSIEEIDGDLIATISVWFRIKIDDDFYITEKQFQNKLVRQTGTSGVA
jgi:hypothetical protein